MKTKSRKIKMLLSLFLALLIGLQAMPVHSQDIEPPTLTGEQGSPDENITGEAMQFGMIGAGLYWVAMNGEIYLTKNDAQTWTNISPIQSLENLKHVTLFADGKGSIITVRGGSETMSAKILQTDNFGSTWREQESNLSFALSDSHAGPIGEIYVQWLNANEAWLMAKRATGINFSQGVLLKTSDGGKYWQALPSPVGERFVFLDSKTGLMKQHGTENDAFYSTDGGNSWNEHAMDIEPMDQAQLMTGLPILMAQGGFLLPVEVRFDDNGRQVGFYSANNSSLQTAFSGDFELVTHSVIESTNFLHTFGIDQEKTLRLELETENLSFADQKQALALFSGGTCRAEQGENICRYVRELHKTEDGGKSWALIKLPDGHSGQIRLFALEEPIDTVENNSTNNLVGSYSGQAFDACEVPKLPHLDIWFNESPYRAVNLYIGGISRACPNVILNEDYINDLARIGWRLIPTWVGHQAPCTSFKYPFSWNPDEAYAQGVSNANEAKARMEAFGLLDANDRGGLVYLDLEHFDTSNSACVAASRAYVAGWTQRLNDLGIMGGLYASATNLNRAPFYNINPVPPAVWIAAWLTPPGYRPEASAYGMPALPDSYWYKKRIRQYSGVATENWGGITLNIDPNVADGYVMKKTDLPPSKPFVSIYISGEKGIDPYYKSQVNVFITAVDYDSGINKIYYKTDLSNWQEYKPFGINGSGKRTISFYAVNNAGLSSGVKTASFYVDNQPPVNPRVIKSGCNIFANGIPQAFCNNAHFRMSAGYDAGVGLHPTESYQYYWGTNPNGTYEGQSTTLLHFDPDPVPARVPYYLRVRSQDKHNKWSAWETIFILHYDPDFIYSHSYPCVLQ